MLPAASSPEGDLSGNLLGCCNPCLMPQKCNPCDFCGPLLLKENLEVGA